MDDTTTEEHVVKKRKNAATSERLKRRKTQQASVVVKGINAVLKEYPDLTDKIQATVETVSILSVSTSWALNHHLLYCFEQNKKASYASTLDDSWPIPLYKWLL